MNNVVVSGQPHQQLLQQLDLMIRARYPLLYIVSVEEEPVEQVLHQLTQTSQPPRKLLFWDIVTGWDDRLSKKTGRNYRLPSDADWEYACRAGTTTPFHFGETITTELANYDGNKIYGNAPKGKYIKQTTSVGSFPPNAFGLYDLHGNLYEWCEDTWHNDYIGAPIDGSAWIDINSIGKKNIYNRRADTRVKRGGGYNSYPDSCRSASRRGQYPDNGYRGDGFRVVCDAGVKN